MRKNFLYIIFIYLSYTIELLLTEAFIYLPLNFIACFILLSKSYWRVRLIFSMITVELFISYDLRDLQEFWSFLLLLGCVYISRRYLLIYRNFALITLFFSIMNLELILWILLSRYDFLELNLGYFYLGLFYSIFVLYILLSIWDSYRKELTINQRVL